MRECAIRGRRLGFGSIALSVRAGISSLQRLISRSAPCRFVVLMRFSLPSNLHDRGVEERRLPSKFHHSPRSTLTSLPIDLRSAWRHGLVRKHVSASAKLFMRHFRVSGFFFFFSFASVLLPLHVEDEVEGEVRNARIGVSILLGNRVCRSSLRTPPERVRPSHTAIKLESSLGKIALHREDEESTRSIALCKLRSRVLKRETAATWRQAWCRTD